jgi:hypothetical protein
VACGLICGKCQCSRAGHALRRFVPRCSSLFGVVALESRVIANSKLETETRNPGNRNRKSESEVESRKSKGRSGLRFLGTLQSHPAVVLYVYLYAKSTIPVIPDARARNPNRFFSALAVETLYFLPASGNRSN